MVVEVFAGTYSEKIGEDIGSSDYKGNDICRISASLTGYLSSP